MLDELYHDQNSFFWVWMRRLFSRNRGNVLCGDGLMKEYRRSAICAHFFMNSVDRSAGPELQSYPLVYLFASAHSSHLPA
jgi:hypothetical protein